MAHQFRMFAEPESSIVGEIGVDLFAGGGGWSEGFKWAMGVPPAVAVNHDRNAILMHTRNHPETEHHHTDIFEVDPIEATRGRKVGWLHLSPDCTHFSRAKGGQPKSQKIRALASIAIPWAHKTSPKVISLENVPEFVTWGPLDSDGQPIKARAGENFREFVAELESLGYEVQWRTLVACDYGAPTSRKRLFLMARNDGRTITWPNPTHGPKGTKPYRTAAECIDWSITCPSIFDRTKPLADATLRRIAEGIKRYVLEAKRPFLVNLTHGGRLEDVDKPFATVTGANRGEKALITPSLIQTGYGERENQRPRVLDINQPLGTIVSGGGKHALVAGLLKHYGGVVGQPLDRPLGTITAQDHHSLLTATITTETPERASMVAAFISKYYGNDEHGQAVDVPLHTISTKDRFSLVTVPIDGETWVLADIGMRMLTPRELARAQGFPDEYVLIGTKTEQIARIGNSVPPHLAAALVSANMED